MARRVSSPIFVGRVGERAALTDAVERAADRSPGLVVIGGEAGVGKSRLLGEIRPLAAGNDAIVVGGVCVELAAGTLPLGPFVDVVRGLHRAGRIPALPAPSLAELARLVPELAPVDGATGDRRDGGQGRLFAAIRDVLGATSDGALLIVTLEDVHWADTTTLDLIAYLARSLTDERLLIVATARLEELSRRHPLTAMLAELERLPWVERIELARFDREELAHQIIGIRGETPDPAFVDEVFQRSDGNPFFAEELLASGPAPGTLPRSLREVLAARLASLGDGTQAVLRVAAVAGRTVAHELLERVTAHSPEALLESIREALDQRVLVPDAEGGSGYTFRHALVREAAADELLPFERVAIHRAIADALERDPSLAPAGDLTRYGEIAHHAMASHDLPRALTASLQAVHAAEQASAFAEAEVHLERALELWDRVSEAARPADLDHAELLIRAARAAAFAHHQPRAIEFARAALGELDPSSDRDRRVRTLLELVDYAWETAAVEAGEVAVAEAVRLLGEERSALRAMALAASASIEWHRGRNAAAHDAARMAVAIARECGARREEARALVILGQALAHLGRTEAADAALADAARIFEAEPDPVVRARSYRWRAWAAYLHGAYERSLGWNLEGLEVARRDGSDGRYGTEIMDGVLESLIELGRWSEVPMVAAQLLARATVSFVVVYVHVSVSRMYTLQGRFADAAREIASAAEIAAVGPHRVWQLEDSILLAYASGRHDEGRRAMDEVIATSTDPDRDAILWWPLLKAVAGEADRAVAARRRRRADEARDAVDAGRRYAALLRRSGAIVTDSGGTGPLLTATILGAAAEQARLEGSADPGAWAATVDARLALGQPWEVAYARYRHAEAILSAGGSAVDAGSVLRDAHAAAVSLGAAPLRADIEALARRARIRLDADGIPAIATAAAARSPAGPRVVMLSPRELEVLALVAAGHTNREIADRLFISEKTVSVHVTHAMDKLGALSRYEAAATATRLGLLEPVAAP